jgi:hypothetical protein
MGSRDRRARLYVVGAVPAVGPDVVQGRSRGRCAGRDGGWGGDGWRKGKMKTAKEIYGNDLDGEPFYGPCEYSPILAEFGEIVVKVDDNDYQGDSRVLYRDGDRWGYLQFGWGSCSGCDALQACDTFAEIDALMSELQGQIRWFDSAAEALDFFRSHDWEGDYCCQSDEQNDFIQKATAALEKAA